MATKIKRDVFTEAVRQIEADAASCLRHWTQVRDTAAVRAADKDAPASWLRSADRELRVATAAVAHIERTGRTVPLVLGQAAAALGVVW